MAIREDLVTSAVQFLKDPNVSSSTIENRIAFLRSKNLTQEEVDVALARASSPTDAPSPPPAAAAAAAPLPPGTTQYYQPYPPQYPWQQSPPPIPKRDWRDWFIMATVMGGLGYGLFALTKRYVYPMIAPPTPERLEQDKKSIEEQFQRVFALVEQVARDTEALKEADRERTTRLDAALSELEAITKDLRISNREHDIDGRRIRDEVQSLKDSIPKAMDAQKEMTEKRLIDVNKELVGLKTLVTGMNSPAAGGVGFGHLRPTSGNANTTSPSQSKPTADGIENVNTGVVGSGIGSGRSSPFTGTNPTAKPSIPAWQLAMAQKSSSDAGGSFQDNAGTSS